MFHQFTGGHIIQPVEKQVYYDHIHVELMLVSMEIYMHIIILMDVVRYTCMYM